MTELDPRAMEAATAELKQRLRAAATQLGGETPYVAIAEPTIRAYLAASQQQGPEIKGLVCSTCGGCGFIETAHSDHKFECPECSGTGRTGLAPSVGAEEPTLQAPIPEGMVLLPDELNGEMWLAGRRVFEDEAERFRATTTTAMAMAIADRAPEKIFAAIIAAATPAPQAEPGAGG